jgi:hypothetical protein
VRGARTPDASDPSKLRLVHPIEMLRAVARSRRGSPTELALEASWGLAALAYEEPAAVLPACRRLLERQPGCGPLWWLSARILVAGDPAAEAERCGSLLEEDPTSRRLQSALRSGSSASESGTPGRRAVRHGGVGEVASADVLVVEASALGPDSMVVGHSSRALLQAAAASGTPVWVESGVGRLLPPKLWAALAARFEGEGLAMAAGDPGTVLGVEGVELIVDPTGSFPAAELAYRAASADCQEPPELLSRW